MPSVRWCGLRPQVTLTASTVAPPTLVEEGLRVVLSSPGPEDRYVLQDLRTGNPGAEDPLEAYSWPELRDLIYGDGKEE